jgi:hypothetical protein
MREMHSTKNCRNNAEPTCRRSETESRERRQSSDKQGAAHGIVDLHLSNLVGIVNCIPFDGQQVQAFVKPTERLLQPVNLAGRLHETVHNHTVSFVSHGWAGKQHMNYVS